MIGLTLISVGYPLRTFAQSAIVPDATLGNESSIVQPLFDQVAFDGITGGATRGNALFHSFSQFNVGNQLVTGFIVAPDIQNIFVRVTGNERSEILGRLATRTGALGALQPSSANLFLLNPNGILFGPNARLDLAGSFMASTASRLQFANGQTFDAITPQPAPILNVNLPLGLQFGSRSASINVNGSTLRIPFGKNLSLLGGEVTIVNATIGENLGQIDLGAVGRQQTVQLLPDRDYWQVDYAGVRNFENIQIRNSTLFIGASNLSNRQIPSGNIYLQANNIAISNNSLLGTSYSNLNQVTAPAGLVRLSASDRIDLDTAQIGTINSTSIPSSDVQLNSKQVNLLDGVVLTGARGVGQTGNISINASDAVRLRSSNQGQSAIFTSNNSPNAIGGGNITINTANFQQLDGSNIRASLPGSGKAGDITINATEQILIAGEGSDIEVPSTLGSFVESRGNGLAGNINLVSKNIVVQDGGSVESRNIGIGQTGIISLQASDRVTISGTTRSGLSGGIDNSVSRNARPSGNSVLAPGIEIRAKELLIKDGGAVSTVSLANGNSRGIQITVTDGVIIQGVASNRTDSNFFAASAIETTKLDGTGDAGDIQINARYVQISDGGEIDSDISKTRNSTTTGFQGKAGAIVINAQDFVIVEGQSLEPLFPGNGLLGNTYLDSNISSNVSALGNGTGGSVKIVTGDLLVRGGADISATTNGQGNAGEVTIEARGIVRIVGEGKEREKDFKPSLISTSSSVRRAGDAGTVKITADSLSIEDGARVSSSTDGVGRAGNVVLNVNRDLSITRIGESTTPSQVVTRSATSTPQRRARNLQRSRELGFVGSELLLPELATGDGGTIQINATNLQLSNKGEISALSDGQGQAGNIQINLRDRLTLNNATISTQSDQTAGGEISINARSIRLFGDSDIQSRVASGVSNGGSITLTARSIIAFDDSDILAFARDGRGGDIRFNTSAFFAENYQPRLTDWEGNQVVDINASGAISGLISLPDTSYVQNSLNPLNQGVTDPNQLIAKTCIQRTRNSAGSLYVLGKGGLPDRPGDIRTTEYPTGDVRDLSPSVATKPWQKGDPIVEPQGAYQLSNGEWILSQACGS